MVRIKNILGALGVCAGILVGIIVLGYIMRPTDTDGAYEQIETFHSLPEKSLEVMVYGSSHAFTGMNTMELYRKYGIGAYNYGWHWQALNTIKLFLRDSLTTQKPKVALIETYTVRLVLEDMDVDAQIYYSRYIKDKEAKREYMKQCMGDSPSLERRLSYIMPLAMFHDNWSSLTPKSFEILKPGGNVWLRRNMGFSPSDAVTEIDIAGYDQPNQLELQEPSRKELDEILRICRENEIEVVFYAVPWEGGYQYLDAMKQYAEENDCVFLDLCTDYEKVGLDGKTDYKDKGHLNTSGATKVADYVGKYLKEHYDLTDMRKIDNNLWEQMQ